MNREEQQRREEQEHVARFFLRHFGYVPQFAKLPTNSRPDVCVQFEGKRVGIELTRAVDSARAVFDTYCAAMLSGARARFAELNGLPGMIMVSMLAKYDPKNAKAYDIGVQLAQDVAAQWIDPAGVTIIERHQLSPVVARVVNSARAFAVQSALATDWQSPVTAWVQGITNERLQPIIDSKAADLPEYRKMGCDEYWLLIYARVGKAAEIFDESHGFDRSTLVSPFDRTFFYDGWRSITLCDARPPKR